MNIFIIHQDSSDVVLQKYVCPFLRFRENLQSPLTKMDIGTFAIQRQSCRPWDPLCDLFSLPRTPLYR